MNSPIKLMEYMNARLPVVANDYNPEQKRIINESDGGICTGFTVQEFGQAISKLIKNKKLRKKMGINGQKYIRKHRNYQLLANQVEQKFLSLINKPPNSK